MRAVRGHRHQRGVALVLVVLAVASLFAAFLLYNSLGPVSKRLDARSTNVKSFSTVDAAIVRFAMTNRRLPCPAIGTQRTGLSDPNGAAAICNTPAGIVPWATLGLSESDAIDSWGRYISYRVFDGATGFTSGAGFDMSNCLDQMVLTGYATGACAATRENTVSDSVAGRGLIVNDLGAAKTGIAYVLISHGESGNGAYFPGATAPLAMPASGAELSNVGSGGTYWIMTPSGPNVGADSTAHFDDSVSYVDAASLAVATRLPRAWPLGIIFNAVLPNSATSPPLKLVSNTMPAIGAVQVTANSGTVCPSSSSPVGIAPCTGGALLRPGDSLIFDFKVKRTRFLISLADFKYDPPNDNERVQLTFYNGSTPVGLPVTLTACSMTGAPAEFSQYNVTPLPSGTEFTRVQVIALSQSGTPDPSKVAITEVAACHSSSIAPCKLSTTDSPYSPQYCAPVSP